MEHCLDDHFGAVITFLDIHPSTLLSLSAKIRTDLHPESWPYTVFALSLINTSGTVRTLSALEEDDEVESSPEDSRIPDIVKPKPVPAVSSSPPSVCIARDQRARATTSTVLERDRSPCNDDRHSRGD